MSAKQQLLIEYLISSPDTFAMCKAIIKPSYFDPEYRQAVAFVQAYYDQHHTTPDPDQIFAETDCKLSTRIVKADQLAYCAEEVERFCRLEAIKDAVRASMQLIKNENFGEIEGVIKEAIAVSLSKDLGVEYFDDPAARLEKYSQEATRISTGWPELDDHLNGGMARTEILLLSANSGGGKSITLANFTVNMLSRGLHVLYLSLELAEYLVSQRFDTMFSGVSSVVWKQRKNQIVSAIEQASTNSGKLTIKHMASGTNSNQIRSYLKEYELKYNRRPDVIVVDYLDLMGTNEKVSADNVSEKDKRATEQLRDIGFDYNAIIATASQQNRSAIDAPDLNQSHIAGGLTKVNTVDVWASIIFTPAMKNIGEIAFKLLKTRNSDGVGQTVRLGWDPTRLRITSTLSQGTVALPVDKYQAPKEAVLDASDPFSAFGADFIEQ